MNLSDTQIDEIAVFLGRRLDPALTPTPPPASAQEAERRAEAWSRTLVQAREKGTLTALFTRLARRHPDDANLQSVARLVTAPERGEGAAVFALLAGVGAAGAVALTGLVALGIVAWSGWPRDAASTGGIAELAGTGEVRPVRLERAASPAAPVASGRCASPDGGRVGWFDAGSSPPGERGAVLTVAGRHNVRVERPSADNRWDTRSRIACVLRPGDRVRLSEDPVRVAGGRWWVPLTSGDLRPPDGDAAADATP